MPHRCLDEKGRRGLAAVVELARAEGREVKEDERFMNKDKGGVQVIAI